MTDAFDTMFPRRAPMTGADAMANLAEMRVDTSKKAMRRLLQVAIGPLGNLTDDARAVYTAELDA